MVHMSTKTNRTRGPRGHATTLAKRKGSTPRARSRPRPASAPQASRHFESAGPITPEAMATRLGLDRERGAAWLRELAAGLKMDHVRYGDAVYFFASDVQASLAWLWFLSEHIRGTERQRLRAEAVGSKLSSIARAIATRAPNDRLSQAMTYRGHCFGTDQYVRTVDIDQAAALGWSVGDAVWPLEVRVGQMDYAVAMSTWFGMSDDARRRAVRMLAGEAKGAARGAC
jgi:hypothetical protein